MDNFDYIECGDSLELTKKLPSGCVDLVITSPPYFNLRDYEQVNQIGTEKSVAEYLDNLIRIFNEVKRVLKDSGSLWVNIDDVYCQKDIAGVKKSSLMCIPDRFKIMMVENGWICRNEVIWRKPNAMPSSAKNRFNNDYEKFYFFTKNNDYKFNTQYEPMKTAILKASNKHISSKYDSIEDESKVRQGMNRNRGNKIIALRKNLPTQEQFVTFMRSRTTIEQIKDNSNIKKSTIEHWFRKDKGGFCFPSTDDWNEIKWLVDDYSSEFQEIDERLNKISYETDAILKNASNGRIKRSVWDICTKPFKGKHFASYPEELVKTPILACTNEGDVVLDIFSGSGTTAVVSMKLKRHYIGFELNPEYCEISRQRIEQEKWKNNCKGQINLFDRED